MQVMNAPTVFPIIIKSQPLKRCKIHRKIPLLVTFCFLICGKIQGQNLLDPSALNGENIKPAMLYWDYGSPEYLTIETIYPSRDSLGQYWNITHRSPHLDENTGNGFDYYRINRKNVKPILSHMYHQGFTNYKIQFNADSAIIEIKKPKDTIQYNIEIPNYVAPEGPGTPVFLASLPLRENYHILYNEINRWSGKNPKTGEIQLTELKVIGIDTLTIEGKEYNTYILEITTQKGRYTKIWALKDLPHYWVKVEHKIDDERTMRSKVIKVIMD